ncbi:MAG: hypothetical protein ACLGGY_08385, partial [Gammaproteobacteria bacterium]
MATSPTSPLLLQLGRSLLLSTLLCIGPARAQLDMELESAASVNEGSLQFLETVPVKRYHHHQNQIRIDADSLSSGWVHLSQCHDNLDAVERAQITFREGFVRDLKVERFSRIADTWIEGASVQLRNIERGARLCLSAQTRALRHNGNGYYNLLSGPYMRKFLDGYYPMRVALAVDYPSDQLTLIDVSPAPQPGFKFEEAPGHVGLDALF